MFRFSKKQIFSLALLLVISSIGFVLVNSTFAQVDTGLNYAQGTGLGVQDPRVIIANVIRILLGFLGIVATVIIIYAGWMYMASQGNQEQIDKAKKILLNGVIGLVIILSAFAIASFVLSRLLTSTGGTGTGGCLAGEHYCAGMGCVPMSTPCSSIISNPYYLRASNIIPPNESKSYPMNTVGLVAFNQDIKDDVGNFDSSGGDNLEVIATTSRSISFSSGDTCQDVRDNNPTLDITVPSGYENEPCMVPSDDTEPDNVYKYSIVLSGYEKYYDGTANDVINCGVGGEYCRSDFSVTNAFDITDPNLSVYSTRGMCAGDVEIRARATDDYGISFVEFEVGSNIETVYPNGSLIRNFYATTSMTLTEGTYDLTVSAEDISGHSTSTDRTLMVYPDHCCNGIQDSDETDVDCGGSCGSCEGGACAIDMTADCSVAGNCDDNLCSGYLSCECDDDSDAGDCIAAGYDPSLEDSCCICRRKPLIEWITPQGGFCDGDYDVPCVTDSDCDGLNPATCNQLTGNGAEGNLITIGGKNFGDMAGDIDFSDNNGTSWTAGDPVNVAECNTNWTDTQIITVVPGLSNGSLDVRVTNENGLYDYNNDTEWGYNVDFLLNDIERPGLCKISNNTSIDCTRSGGECPQGVECLFNNGECSDNNNSCTSNADCNASADCVGKCNTNYGRTGDTINYYGLNLGGTDANFGSIYNPIIASGQGLSDGDAGVPMLSNGLTSTFASSTSEKTFSNYLDFIKIPEAETGPQIISFTPLSGKEGQYVTINGVNFGTVPGGTDLDASSDFAVYFSTDPSLDSNDVKASFDFPDVCSDSLWTNTQIITKTPSVADGMNNGSSYYLIVKTPAFTITSEDVRPTSNNRFIYNQSIPLTAGLCKISPTLGRPGDDYILYGENFIDNSDGYVKFGGSYNNSFDNDRVTPEGFLDLADEIDNISVPGNAIEGEVEVFVISNAFDSCSISNPCDSGQECYLGNCYTLSNSKKFTVGSCIVNRAPDDNICVLNGSTTCCPLGSMYEGQCILDVIDECYSKIPNSVYEWEFSTNLGGQIGDPCSASTTACVADQDMCGENLDCEPNSCTCQMPCDSATSTPTCDADNDLCTVQGMYCDPVSCYCEADSCRGQSTITAKCEGFCPNAPGQCSFEGASVATSTDYKCDSSVDCNEFSGCDGNNCSINLDLSKCVTSTCSLATTTKDVLGNTIPMYCKDYNNSGQWHINTNLSCPSGWLQLFGNECASTSPSASCDLCVDGLNCINDNDNDYEGVCASPENLCPNGFACNSTGECAKDVSESCECCCRKGNINQDCCSPLTCEGSCGGDPVNFGLCSGCAAIGDAACICEGHEAQYCDVTDSEFPSGVCRDCSLISDPDVCTSAGTCCWDATMDNGNGRCSGITIGGVDRDTFTELGVQYCAYYDCDRTDIANPTCGAQTNDASTTGEFAFYNDCTSNCSYEPEVGQSCFDDVYGNCGLACKSPYQCIGKSGCNNTQGNAEGTCLGGDDSCRCCCDPGDVNSCNGEGMVDLTCHPNQEPCDTESTNPNARGLCCGCGTDSDCGIDSAVAGCSSDTCCRPRPEVEFEDPFDGMATTCRNKEIQVGFDQKMDISSINDDNFILLGKYFPGEDCPDGTTYLTLNRERNNANIFVKIYYKIKYFVRVALSPVLGGYKVIAQTAENYCVVDGSVSSTVVNGNSVLTFTPSDLLDSDRTYYGIVKTDSNLRDGNLEGVVSTWGVGMASSTNGHPEEYNAKNLINSYIFEFKTLGEDAPNNGVCLVDSVLIKPHNYLFKTYVDDTNDNYGDAGNFDQISTDRDRVYTANAYGQGQLLATSSQYDWTYNWNLTNRMAFATSSENPPINKVLPDDKTWMYVQRELMEAQTRVIARLDFDSGNEIGSANSLFATTTAFLFVCNNPWPAVLENETWNPWEQGTLYQSPPSTNPYELNHMFYYCRDSGSDSIYDDLPSIKEGGASVSYGFSLGDPDGQLMTETYFPVNESIGYSNPNFSVNSVGDGSVRVEFALGTDYVLYYGTESGNYPYKLSIPNNVDYRILDSLNNIELGEAYYFNLKAITTGANATTTPFFGEIGPIMPLLTATSTDKPQNFTVASGDGELALSWDSVDRANAYNLYFTTNHDNYNNSDGVDNYFGQKKEIDKNTTNAVIRNLENGVTYYFGITSVSIGGNESEFDDSTKLGAIPVAPVDDLRVERVISGEVELSWSPADGAENYTIYRKSGNETDYSIEGITSNFSYVINGLNNGEKSYFYIESSKTDTSISPNITSTSSLSNEVDAIPFMDTINSIDIIVGTTTNSSIDFYWPDLSNQGVAGYNVYYKIVDNQAQTATSSATYTIRSRHILSGLSSETEYNLYVNPVSLDSVEGYNFNNFVSTTTLAN